MPGNITEFDDAHDGGLPVVNETFDGHLLAPQHSLGDEPLAADRRAGVALKHLIERREELILRRPARQKSGKRLGFIDALGANREEGFHRLDEEREAQAVGKGRSLGDIDQRKRRHGVRHKLLLRAARQIFVLTDQRDGGIGSGKTEFFGDGCRKRGARVVVGADDCGKANAGDLGEDRVHFFERACGEVGVLGDIADQVFETNAGVVVKKIFDALRREARKLAMVAMSGANDEDDAIRLRRSSTFGGRPPALTFRHRRFLHPRGGRTFLGRDRAD